MNILICYFINKHTVLCVDLYASTQVEYFPGSIILGIHVMCVYGDTAKLILLIL